MCVNFKHTLNNNLFFVPLMNNCTITMKFDDLDLCDELLDALYDMHFDECTPIQEMSIPAALDGNDLIAVAQTGPAKPQPTLSQ